MAYTGILGGNNSELGNIVLGSLEQAGAMVHGQAQAKINAFDVSRCAQAQAKISPGLGSGFGQARALIDSPIKSAFGQAQTEIGITPELLTTFSGTSTSVSSGTITPLSNALVLVAFNASNATATSVSGCGLTFEVVEAQSWFNGVLQVWRAQGTTSSGTITIQFSVNNSVAAHVIQFKGAADVLAVGDNGIHAVVQSNSTTDSGNSCPVSLNSFANIHNVTYGLHDASADPINIDTSPAGYNEIVEFGPQSEWLSASDTSVNATIGGLSRLWGGIALEIGRPQGRGYGQAQAILNQAMRVGQAQANIGNSYLGFAQANAYIKLTQYVHGQSQSYVGHFKHAQAQARIGLKPYPLIPSFSGTGTSIISNTISPYFDALILVGILNTGNAVPTSVTGLGLTFEMITSQVFFQNNYTVSAWRAKGYAVEGQVTVTFASSRSIMAHVSQWIGAATDGTNGSGAIIQYNSDQQISGTGVTVPLNTFASINNAVYGVTGGTQGNMQPEGGSGYQTFEHTTTIAYFLTFYRLGQDTSVVSGKLAAPAGFYGGIAVEIEEFVSSRQTWHAQAQATLFSPVQSAYGQAQAHIKLTVAAYGQAQALLDINIVPAQAQADIKQTYSSHGQAQTQIKAIGVCKHGQALAVIVVFFAHGLAQAHINAGMKYAQAQASIELVISAHAQAQGTIALRSYPVAQCAGTIKWTVEKHAQAQAHIKVINVNAYGQTQAYLAGAIKTAQAQARIVNNYIRDTFSRNLGPGTSLGTPDIGPAYDTPATNASVTINGSEGVLTGTVDFHYVEGVTTNFAISDTNMQIDFKYSVFNQGSYIELRTRATTSVIAAYAYIDRNLSNEWHLSIVDEDSIQIVETPISALSADTYYTFKFMALGTTLYAKYWIRSDPEPDWVTTLSNVSTDTGYVRFLLDVGNLSGTTTITFDNYFVDEEFATYRSGQAMAFLNSPVKQQFGQAQAFILKRTAFGQCQANIKTTRRAHGQCQALLDIRLGTGQAQGTIVKTTYKHAQCQAFIVGTNLKYAQALADIRIFHIKSYAQAQGQIKSTQTNQYAQAQAMLGNFARAQAQAKIISFGGQPKIGQAQGYIKEKKYLVRFAGMELPGYAQEEEYESPMTIKTHTAPYVYTSLAEYLGLTNKMINLRMRTWEADYATCKQEVQKAATILRSKKGFEKLYIQHYDKYYLVIPKSLTTQKSVGESMRILDYNVEFEAKPWLISNTIHTISGTGLIDTDQTNRTILNGGWTPTRITVTGTNVTISGYTATGDATGFCSVSGTVVGLQIDAEQYLSTLNGNNANNLMNNKEYQIYVGPGKTYFNITGATSCEISYEDRWYL